MLPHAGNAGSRVNDTRRVEVVSLRFVALANLRHAVAEEIRGQPLVLVRSHGEGAQDEHQREMGEIAQVAHVRPKRCGVRVARQAAFANSFGLFRACDGDLNWQGVDPASRRCVPRAMDKCDELRFGGRQLE